MGCTRKAPVARRYIRYADAITHLPRRAVGAVLSVFEEIYCDVGDSQSIEESLSTFSSHITNIIHIVENANEKSLVLIDELGGGTDPDEGQALAKAIVAHLLSTGCAGVVTTHYTALKEFAFETNGIENV